MAPRRNISEECRSVAAPAALIRPVERWTSGHVYAGMKLQEELGCAATAAL